MGARKRAAAGGAALSAVALATMLGAQPAAAEDTICLDCGPIVIGPGPGNEFSKFNAFVKVSDAFSKIQLNFAHKIDYVFPGFENNAFYK